MPWEDSIYLESIYNAKRKNNLGSGTTITINVTSCPFLSIVFLPPQIAWNMQRSQLSSWFHSVKNTKAPHNYFFFNSLHLNISMHILHSFLHTFLKELTRRICFTIKSFFSWWSFPLLIPHFNVLCNLLLYRRTATCNLIVLQKWLRHPCVSSPIDHKKGPIKMRVQFSLLHEPKVNHAKLTSNLVSLLTNLIPW